MTGIALEIKTENLGEIDAAFNQLIDGLFDLSPVWDDIGGYLASITAERFKTGTAPDGSAWVESERARDEGGVTLTDHGHLRDSFTWNVIEGGRAMEFGSGIVYAGIHQFGGETGRGHATTLPARPMLPDEFSAADETEILNILNRHLNIQ